MGQDQGMPNTITYSNRKGEEIPDTIFDYDDDDTDIDDSSVGSFFSEEDESLHFDDPEKLSDSDDDDDPDNINDGNDGGATDLVHHGNDPVSSDESEDKDYSESDDGEDQSSASDESASAYPD
eukprot:12255323-Ditylum_brightwellii.AAC.1